MNAKPKLIADIRYYENPGRTEFGNVRHDSLGTLYSIPFRSFGAIGDRFACKLREREFTLPGFDHLYVILTPALPPGIAEPSTLNMDARIRYVDVGLVLDQWDSLDDDAKHDHIVDLTSFAINAFDGTADTLANVAADLKRYRSKLEIIVKTKETSSYRVDVSFQIRPMQEQSIAFVSYTDKRAGQRGRTTLTKLQSANDVYPLCGSIAVRDNTITIKPRSSSRAATITDKYNVPLSVAVDAVLAAHGTEQCGEPEPPMTRDLES
ncbi:hypothetical protein [Stieleria varia]|nr:hypothetical protein [Stieleria varia]